MSNTSTASVMGALALLALVKRTGIGSRTKTSMGESDKQYFYRLCFEIQLPKTFGRYSDAYNDLIWQRKEGVQYPISVNIPVFMGPKKATEIDITNVDIIRTQQKSDGTGGVWMPRIYACFEFYSDFPFLVTSSIFNMYNLEKYIEVNGNSLMKKETLLLEVLLKVLRGTMELGEVGRVRNPEREEWSSRKDKLFPLDWDSGFQGFLVEESLEEKAWLADNPVPDGEEWIKSFGTLNLLEDHSDLLGIDMGSLRPRTVEWLLKPFEKRGDIDYWDTQLGHVGLCMTHEGYRGVEYKLKAPSQIVDNVSVVKAFHVEDANIDTILILPIDTHSVGETIRMK